MRRLLLLILALSSTVAADETGLPIIDMHLHADVAAANGPPPMHLCVPFDFPAWDQREPYGAAFMRRFKQPDCDDPISSPMTDEELLDRTVEAMERNNVYGVLSGPPERVAAWQAAAPGRFWAGIDFRLVEGRDYSPQTLTELHEAGRLDVFAEVTNQYEGIEPDDARMAPNWSLMEELDIPVGIHIGTGPPGVIYLGSPDYRARMHSPLALEEVLAAHPRLRVYVMHAGFPMLDDTLALLYAHPQVYVGIGVIAQMQPRPVFYRYLKSIVDAGFGERVLFGSDQMVWPELIDRGIAVVQEAPFLSEEQKRDILYNNAARFLRLSDEIIAAHHGRGN